MMTTLLIAASLLAAGFFVEIFAANSAPVGYEDETGFHFGAEQAQSVPDEALLAHRLACKQPA